MLQDLIDKIPGRPAGMHCSGLHGSGAAYFVCQSYFKLESNLVVIVPSTKEALRFMEDLRFYAGENPLSVIFFPPRSVLPFKSLSYQNQTTVERIAALYRLMDSERKTVLVAPLAAVMQKVIPKKELVDFAELVVAGEEMDRNLFVEKLVSGGYRPSIIVDEPGDFCIRGGILDVFSPQYPDPLRMEFFGDLVDSLRFFSAATQRKTRDVSEVIILPAKEAVVKKTSMDQVVLRARTQASAQNLPVTVTRDLIDRIRKEQGLFDNENILPLAYAEPGSLFDYVSDGAVFFLLEPVELARAADELDEILVKNRTAAQNEKRLWAEPDALYLKWPAIHERIQEKKPVIFETVSILKGDSDLITPAQAFQLSIQDHSALKGKLQEAVQKENLLLPLAEWIQGKKNEGFLTLLVCSTRSQAERIRSLMAPYGIQPDYSEGFPAIRYRRGAVFICIGKVSSGFVWPLEKLAVITEDDIFGSKYRRRKSSGPKVRSELLGLEELKKGDFIVHDEHGIGKYDGLFKLQMGGLSNDFLSIIYRGDDRLYLPVDRMNMIRRYVGTDGIIPPLDKMGGNSWDRVKKKVKKSAEKIAGDLLNLYAERKVRQGFAYAEPDSYFRDFEAGFSYEETDDQLKAIDDVVNDMTDPRPMDRLICGDVGYGKTEVALRAAFLAVNEGRQVAVLVPTTVLAEQHYLTFSHRFARYPVQVACLSRFRPLPQQRTIVGDLKAGKIDVVIGTHRLLQKDVVFKDLGLIIIDEEQRFGVQHKEKLKQIRTTVDVLALTATPIPRTLHLSLMGIRDVSVISTPPEHRHSIMTYISEFNYAVISEAIRKELKRKGQIFFVHNNIHSIWAIARKLQEIVPEVRLGVAHGRLNDKELEAVMLQFVDKKIDMLVTTTIIESGLDIPSANTILINRSDRFGLAQIYQLRGRVGRADEQAYAYLFVPKDNMLGKDAQKRLAVLMEHSDLGAGFQIAMNDLQIRGGGTILGASQSGHIAAVGYDMFLELIETAISELKGEAVQERLEPEINISMSAFIPEAYMPDIDLRLSAYRRLARMNQIQEISDYKKELIDRFGPLPEEALNLLLKIMLKVWSIQAGVKRLDISGQNLVLAFSGSHQKNPSAMADMLLEHPTRFKLTPDHTFKARMTSVKINGLIVETKNILKEISRRVNG